MTEPVQRANATVSRRTVNKVAAWSVPAIAATVAMPLVAASTTTVAAITVSVEPTNVPKGKAYGEMVLQVTDQNGQPITSGFVTLAVTGTGSLAAPTVLPVKDGVVTVPAGTIIRTAGDAETDDIHVTAGYGAGADDAVRMNHLVTLRNHEVIKLFHDQDSLATTGVDWTLETRPSLKSTVFPDFFIRPRIEAGPRWSKAKPMEAVPIMSFDPKLAVKVSVANGNWGFGSTETNNDGLIDKHNGEHRLAYLYQQSITEPVVVTGSAEYSTRIGGEKRVAHIRMTWPVAGRDSNQIDQWETRVA